MRGPRSKVSNEICLGWGNSHSYACFSVPTWGFRGAVREPTREFDRLAADSRLCVWAEYFIGREFGPAFQYHGDAGGNHGQF